MSTNTSKRNKKEFTECLLKHLLSDPTKSTVEIANALDTYRQRVYREKTRLENKHIIWGYTAVLNESKLNQVTYLVFLKTKPMSMDLAELITTDLLKEKSSEQQVRLLDLLYVNGEYDWVLKFAAPDYTTARKYYEGLRLTYETYLLEKPVIVDVSFSLVKEGVKNPEAKQLLDLAPL